MEAEARYVTAVRHGASPAARPVAAGCSGPLPTVPDGTGLDAVAERSPVYVSGTAGQQEHRRRVNGLTPRPGSLGLILGKGAARKTNAPAPAARRVRDQRSAGAPSVGPNGQ